MLKEEDSSGKCFNGVPGGICEKALKGFELKVEQLESRFN